LQWRTPYNGSTSSIDYANHIVVDSDGIPTSPVGAAAQITCHDMTTINYDPDGNELWSSDNGSADDNDYAYWPRSMFRQRLCFAGQSVETGS